MQDEDELLKRITVDPKIFGAIDGIRKGLADMKHGRTRPLREALDDLCRRYEAPRRQKKGV